jgi:glutathione S-transferase
VITLYHGLRSVCSAKVRITLAEKRVPYEDRIIDLSKGEQFSEWYLKLNPAGVVPTLVDDRGPIAESSVIIQYLDDISDENPLMPSDPYTAALVRRYLLRCLEVHSATNTLTVATAIRLRELTKSEGEREAGYRRMPSLDAAIKRRDLVDNGLSSTFVDGALQCFDSLFKDLERDLERADSDWIFGQFSLADIAVIAYVDRLDRLGLDGFWASAHPKVSHWMACFKERPSYITAIEAFNDPVRAPGAYRREVGREAWPLISAKLAQLTRNSSL